MPLPTQDTARLPLPASTGRPATGGCHLGLGVHIIAFAVIWKLLFFHGLGAALMICGVAVSSWPRSARVSARSTSWVVSCPEPSSADSGCGAPREALTPGGPVSAVSIDPAAGADVRYGLQL